MSYFDDVNLSVLPGTLMVDGSRRPPTMYMIGGDLCELAYMTDGGATAPEQGETLVNLIPGYAVYILRVDMAQDKVLCIMRKLPPPSNVSWTSLGQ